MKILGKVNELKEITGDIWEHAKRLDAYVVIPTNGTVKKNGECIMGAGLAKQAAERYPELPAKLGENIRKYGNRLYIFEWLKIITFPVKRNWWDRADLKLIEKSTKDLVYSVYCSVDTLVLVPRVGCGNGGLLWSNVKPVILKNAEGITNIILCSLEE